MEIKEIRKRKAELESTILILLREFATQTGMDIERIELLRMFQARIGTKDYSELISVEVKTAL